LLLQAVDKARGLRPLALWALFGRRLRLLPKIFLPLADRFYSLVIYVEEGFAFSQTLIHQRITSSGLRGFGGDALRKQSGGLFLAKARLGFIPRRGRVIEYVRLRVAR